MINNLKEKYNALAPYLTEKTRRLYAASECLIGTHGIKGKVSRATGVSYREIRRGLSELKKEAPKEEEASDRIRNAGGGRKSVKNKTPELAKELKNLVEPSTLGDPCVPLLYTSRSLSHSAKELKTSICSVATVKKNLNKQGDIMYN